MAFAPSGGWRARLNDGSIQWDQLPRSLDKKLSEDAHTANFVSVSESGGWFTHFGSHWSYHAIDNHCDDIVRE